MGTVVSMNREKAIINVGLKSEGFISLNEFKDVRGELEITEGDIVEVAAIYRRNKLTADIIVITVSEWRNGIDRRVMKCISHNFSSLIRKPALRPGSEGNV